MTTVLAGLGPAGRGVLSALIESGRLAEVCREGLIVVDPSHTPGGGALHEYNVRSDSAAIVFAECVKPWRDEVELRRSSSLAHILELPEGESVALPYVGQLLSEATVPIVRVLREHGADVRLGSRVSKVSPRATGGAVVTVAADDGGVEQVEASRLILALGGVPYVPSGLAARLGEKVRHSDELLRPEGLRRALESLPSRPRVVVVGRAHSAFAVTDRLLSSDHSRVWGPAAVMVATRGKVRVTYPDAATARRDGASFTPDDVCPQSRRVWRLCGLRGDSALRYRLGRDGLDPRLVVRELHGDDLAGPAADADLVVTATGYRARGLHLLPGAMSCPDGRVIDGHGRTLSGIRMVGLGSGSRRSDLGGGEPSYTGPVDGVWHYQHVVAPALLDGLFGPSFVERIAEVELAG